MSVNYPLSTDEPVRFAIMPDWGVGVRQTVIYRTDVTRSRKGLEQRSQRRKRAILGIEYTVSMHDENARRRVETILASSRTPLIIPWWTSGVLLDGPMTTDTAALLASDPIEDDWTREAWVYLWSRANGAEWRQVASRVGRVITFVDTGSHIHFSDGAFIFPGRLAIRENHDTLMESERHRTTRETLTFRTL